VTQRYGESMASSSQSGEHMLLLTARQAGRLPRVSAFIPFASADNSSRIVIARWSFAFRHRRVPDSILT